MNDLEQEATSEANPQEATSEANPQVLLPIVGAIFRPPALTVLSELPFGTSLLLEREPENPYDPEAIRVLLPGFSPEGHHAELYSRIALLAIPEYVDLSRGQFHLSSLTDPLHLGYVGAKYGHAHALAKEMDQGAVGALHATLSALLSGNPAAKLQVSPSLAKEIEAL